MSDLTPKAVYSAYRDDQKSGPLHRPLFLARILAIIVACLGAIPTGYNLYLSYKHGIPYSQVSHRLEQYDLWVKNFDCKIDYRTVSAGEKGTRVDVGACPKSNDIALKLTTTDGKSTYEWIAYNQLEQASKLTSAWSLFVSEAQAEEAPKADIPAGLPPVKMAQATTGPMQVRCEVMAQPGQVIRIVSEGGKCFREHISAMRGKLDKREEVPCNTQCTPAKG
jgi:hypothetical protein